MSTNADRRPELGALLEQLRERAGVSREEAAAVLGCTSSKIGDLELARSKPKPAEAAFLLAKYRVPADERARILAIVQQNTRRKPRGTYTDVAPPLHLKRLAELESQAVAIDYYSSEVIPPPLQVPAYSEAVIAAVEPDHAKVKNLSNFQLARRHIIGSAASGASVTYRCFLGEAALHTNVGGEATMIRQRAHLRDLAARMPNLELRLLPFGSGIHPLLGHSATLYYFRKPAPPRLISELPGHRFVRHRSEPARHAIAAFDLLATTALASGETVHRLG
ncbi:helix-turn-helix domain-containing protein [Saccharothrix sp. AJ9571]|nr:helix-turn-helix domain-containing protein [Saccharothrix sp. AJ9571]